MLGDPAVRIDSHQHFWQFSPLEHGWMTDRYAAIRRDFGPEDLAPHLAAAGIEGTVAVQARESEEETAWLLALADQHPSIRAVVGWADLCAPDAGDQIARIARHPKLAGLRMVIHDRPDVDFADAPDHRRGIAHLAKHGLTYDLLLKPAYMAAAIRLVDQFPNQAFVVDHLAKPDIARRAGSPWRERLAELARRPQVSAKLSGLVTEADWRQWTLADLRPYLDHALDCFGADRLMMGSDWPVCLCAAPYEAAIGAIQEWARALSAGERAAIEGVTAARFYGIVPAGKSRTMPPA
jgi:L-fuconolactonase